MGIYPCFILTTENSIEAYYLTRRIWCSTALNEHLDFPHVGQVFLVERETLYKRTGKVTDKVVLGVTSRTPEPAGPEPHSQSESGSLDH